MNLPQNFVPAMLMTLFAGLTTAIGGGIAFIVKKDNLRVLSVGLGFSAGVMIFLSFTDIIPEASEMLSVNYPNMHEWMVFMGFIIGIVVAILIDYFLPDHVDPDELADPEALTTTQNLTLGITVGLAIAIHNIPEGIAVALPIYHVTGKKRYAMLYAALSGMTEPVGALIGMVLFSLFLPQVLVGILLAAVAGIMIYLSFDTLLPLSREYGNWHLSMVGIVTGMLFIWAGLIILGHG